MKRAAIGEFIDWIASTTHIGYANSVTGCPLARYYRFINNCETAYVACGTVALSNGEQEQLHSWEKDFVSQIDQHKGHMYDLGTEITQRQALEAIGHVGVPL